MLHYKLNSSKRRRNAYTYEVKPAFQNPASFLEKFLENRGGGWPRRCCNNRYDKRNTRDSESSGTIKMNPFVVLKFSWAKLTGIHTYRFVKQQRDKKEKIWNPLPIFLDQQVKTGDPGNALPRLAYKLQARRGGSRKRAGKFLIVLEQLGSAARPFRVLHANELIVVHKSRHAAWWHQTPPFPPRWLRSRPGRSCSSSRSAVCRSPQPPLFSVGSRSTVPSVPGAVTQASEAVGCPSWGATGRVVRPRWPPGLEETPPARLVHPAAPAWRRRPPLPRAPRLSALLPSLAAVPHRTLGGTRESLRAALWAPRWPLSPPGRSSSRPPHDGQQAGTAWGGRPAGPPFPRRPDSPLEKGQREPAAPVGRLHGAFLEARRRRLGVFHLGWGASFSYSDEETGHWGAGRCNYAGNPTLSLLFPPFFLVFLPSFLALHPVFLFFSHFLLILRVQLFSRLHFPFPLCFFSVMLPVLLILKLYGWSSIASPSSGASSRWLSLTRIILAVLIDGATGFLSSRSWFLVVANSSLLIKAASQSLHTKSISHCWNMIRLFQALAS